MDGAITRLRLRAKIACGEEGAMGPGKAALLEAIDRDGSISQAALALGMSYRRAWLLVDVMNRCWAAPLVEASAGGARQGSRLTQCGREVLKLYRGLEESLRAAAAGPMIELSQRLLDHPRS